MALPPFDAAKHDVGINGVGYMYQRGTTQAARLDAVPATARAAEGEGRYDSYQLDSFFAQERFNGGAGQEILSSGDMYLQGIGDGRWGGWFPAKKKQTESDGGVTSYYFRRDTTLYGLTAGFVETIGTATSQARTAGTVYCQPVVSGTGSAFWVQDVSGSRKVYKWTGSGAPADVTPPNTSPGVVGRLGKWVWSLGSRTVASSVSIVQSATNTGTASNAFNATWGSATQAGNCLVAVIWTEQISTNGAVWVTPSDDSAGWEYADTGYRNPAKQFYIYILPNAPSRSGIERFDWELATAAVSTNYSMWMAEVAGIDPDTSIDISNYAFATGGLSINATTTPTLTGPSTGALSRAKGLAIAVHSFGHASVDYVSSTPGAGWTEQVDYADTATTGDSGFVIGTKVLAASTSVNASPTITVSANSATGMTYASYILVLRGSAISADVTQFTVHYTKDDGGSWSESAPTGATGIGTPVACLAAQGSLWFTTNEGLYALKANEHEYEDHVVKVDVGLAGPYDKWPVPYDTSNIGTYLAIWDGVIFTVVGGTVRKFAEGGQPEQIWPTTGWATKAGKVQALVSGEGGIYFGSAGILWNYDGNGFHPLAAEPSAGDFDILYWHGGKLYFKGDPANYFNFQYPSSRPDITFSDSTTMTTGYWVSSRLNFEKVAEWKVIRTAQTHVTFTQTANTGTVLLEYLTDAATVEPGSLGGGATSLSWTAFGTAHGYSDGPVKDYALGTPLECRALWLRATITPGSAGYPRLRAVVVNGRAIMPQVVKLVLPLDITTATVDRQKARMYDTDTDVEAALAAIKALRAPTGSPRYFTVNYMIGNSEYTSYVVTPEQMQDFLTLRRHDHGLGWNVVLSVNELP